MIDLAIPDDHSFKAPEDTDSEEEEDHTIQQTPGTDPVPTETQNPETNPVDTQEDEPIETEHPFIKPANPFQPILFQQPPQQPPSPPAPPPPPPPSAVATMSTPAPKGPKLAAPTPFTGDC
ncbi:hypothetical protein JAAARDRAFT_199806 [Jaapia argillacea MUCL 33604]|uniref:Uncharacterized protein n=1 Tax=Jaapia argillacea MUCL 33604 TaxID=933084 RepID=A0A067PA27_9AGAM|nr:hypothetical protein JAAARDRAFT_199806 [Jaapia argillacea MUCL 33604]